LNVTVFVVRIWGKAIQRGTDIECYCVFCEGLVEGNIERIWYWMLLCLLWWSGGGQYREELILNVTVFIVRGWGGQYREELILKVTLFFLGSGGGQYREELILNITLFVLRVWWRAI